MFDTWGQYPERVKLLLLALLLVGCSTPTPAAPGFASPVANQPVQDELVGYGDGAVTVFTTRFPYLAGTLEVDVAGLRVDAHNTDPAAGTFTLMPAAGSGAAIRVSYRAAPVAAAPPATGTVETLTSANTSADLLAAMAAATQDIIELEDGDYDWQDVEINVDRTARPLTIRPALGATVNFVGPGTESGIIFSLGTTSLAKYITFDGHDSAGGGAMVFRDFELAQSGVFELRGTRNCTFRNLTFDNIGRHAGFSDQPYKSWLFYISDADGVGGNQDLIIEDLLALAPAVNRDISLIQIASSGSHSNITIRRIEATEYHYVFYDERPTTNIVLNDWTITDSGHSPGPFSIRFTGAVAQSGSYSNIVATGSDPYADAHSGGGTIADGGGNSGI